MQREEWISKAVKQYKKYGVTDEKAQLWAESILNNQPELINNSPYIEAEICYKS
jgi:hypothetical protein